MVRPRGVVLPALAALACGDHDSSGEGNTARSGDRNSAAHPGREAHAMTEPARVAEVERLIAHWSATHPAGYVGSLAWEMIQTLQAALDQERQKAQEQAEMMQGVVKVAEDLRAQLTEARSQIRRYGLHSQGCQKAKCKQCGLSLGGGHHEDSYNGDTSWHPFVWSDCTCGLDAALAAPRVPPQEP